MTAAVPRFRLFAGPHGSGKSTLRAGLTPALLGVVVDPDELEREMGRRNLLDLSAYGVRTHADEILGFFCRSPLLQPPDLATSARALSFSQGKLDLHAVRTHPLLAAVAADFLLTKLRATGQNCSFESVMALPEQVEALRQAKLSGYRTCLYYVATEDPLINFSRVKHRIKREGLAVPALEMDTSYADSLALLSTALNHADQAEFFDNSGHQQTWIASWQAERSLVLRTERLPHWFGQALL